MSGRAIIGGAGAVRRGRRRPLGPVLAGGVGRWRAHPHAQAAHIQAAARAPILRCV